jgi:hypothetical protein
MEHVKSAMYDVSVQGTAALYVVAQRHRVEGTNGDLNLRPLNQQLKPFPIRTAGVYCTGYSL